MIKTVGGLKKAIANLPDTAEIVVLKRSDPNGGKGEPGMLFSVDEWEEGVVILVEPYEHRRNRKRSVKLDVEVEFLQDGDIRTQDESAMREAVAAFVRKKISGADDMTQTPRVDGVGTISVVSAKPEGGK